MTTKIMILNGPNLNLLGKRQPEIYGSHTIKDIESSCSQQASKLGIFSEFRQTNSEGKLIDWVQEANENFDGIIINPGAYSHTSLGIMDALLASTIPIIEVHLSNIHSRDEIRHHSLTARAVSGVICGLGSFGYELALQALCHKITSNQ